MFLAACDGPQSALAPAGEAAERIAGLFWWMTGFGLAIWIAVIALAVWSVRVPPADDNRRRTNYLIVGAGAVFPTAALTLLLIYGLAPLPGLIAPAPEGSLKVFVSGEQWWWRVRYTTAAGDSVVLANEIRIPVGEPVQFVLESPDVIHSFWIPSLAGKIDMIPGRITRLAFTANKTGVFRGACAEYCGTSHALMNFFTVVHEKSDFARWLTHQQTPAAEPMGTEAARGRDAFLANGCGACHTIRGTPANGVVGPDLTHVGSRLSIAAGTLPNTVDALQRWIARTEHAKPEVLMPSFGMLSEREIRDMAIYLEGLK